ncbi:unnamed protein product, partial [Effrenium voratum]
DSYAAWYFEPSPGLLKRLAQVHQAFLSQSAACHFATLLDMEAEKEACGSTPDMEEKVRKMVELNALREQCSKKLFADNSESVNSFMVTTDANGMPAIEIGVDPAADPGSVVIPEEIAHVNVIFSTVGRPSEMLPTLEGVDDD